ncbi:MAG: DUF3592 domain-containing protein [Planctomycetota bacterium]
MIRGASAVLLGALLLIGGSIYIQGHLIATLVEWRDMQGWRTLAATLTHLELKEVRGSKGRRSHRVIAKYRYEFDGQAYTGQRVFLHGQLSSLAGHHYRTYDLLRAARDAGESIPCRVNPRRPNEAVLSSELLLEVCALETGVSLGFGLIGLGLAVGVLQRQRAARDRRALAALHPAEPWRHAVEWKDGKVRPERASGPLCIIGLAILAVLFVTPITAALVWSQTGRLSGAAWVALVFPMGALVLAAFAAHATLRWRRFANSWLELAPCPATPGSSLRATLYTSARIVDAVQLKARISVDETRVRRGRRGGKKRQVVNLWHEKIELDPTRAVMVDDLCKIDIETPTPPELPPTTMNDDLPRVDWRLEVRGQVPGLDFFVRFRLPVVGPLATSAPTNAV